jgi:imidazolonepropionase-like amidohydrolase
MTQSLAFQQVHIFDGTRILLEDTVIVQDGVIVAVGSGITPPAEAQTIDSGGKTLLPGLIDAHTHVFGQALKDALFLGVTTELDMFTDYHFVEEVKRHEAAGQAMDQADLRSAGTAVTAPDGHGTEYSIPIPTITAPQQAQEFVDARIAEGSDYIKIIYDDGKAYGRTIPTISKATMAAVVEATHRRGKKAIAHIHRFQDARDAIEVGVDGLAHLFLDELPDELFGRFVAEHHAFVIPTLTVLQSLAGVASGTALVLDEYLAPYLTKELISDLQRRFSFGLVSPNYAIAEETVRQLKAVGVPILAGTDAPNPGTAHGASIHRELELLVQAGLTSLEALAAATSLPATIFDLDDRGRIAPGLRADLLLVDGDPISDISATRAIVGVWKRGIPVDRESRRTLIEQRRTEAEARLSPASSESGLVSDFEDDTTRTLFGSGWNSTTDGVRGGHSTVSYTVVPEGANGGKGSLFISGEVAANSSFSWAGVMFSPGATPGQAANLSNKTGLSFWTKGDGRTYNIMLFAGSFMVIPAMKTFVAGSEWQEVSLTFSEFDSLDSREIVGVAFTAGPPSGAFRFQIDDVRLTN